MEVAVLPSKSAVLLRALVNVLLGLVLLAWPGLTLIILIYAFALNILIVAFDLAWSTMYCCLYLFTCSSGTNRRNFGATNCLLGATIWSC